MQKKKLAGMRKSLLPEENMSQQKDGLPEEESEYRPSEGEAYMCPRQLAYFRYKLSNWKKKLQDENARAVSGLREQGEPVADIFDRAFNETSKALTLRTKDRQRKLIAKIDSALARIESGDYGYCEETGEPITLARLEARPIATLCLKAQERHERKEKLHRDAL